MSHWRMQTITDQNSVIYLLLIGDVKGNMICGGQHVYHYLVTIKNRQTWRLVSNLCGFLLSFYFHVRRCRWCSAETYSQSHHQPTHIIGSYISIKHTVGLCLKLFISFLMKLALVKEISSFFFFFSNNCNNLPPQELLSHSTDRPERQQLKEALEAMQVCVTHCALLHVRERALKRILHNISRMPKAKAV